MSIPPNILFHGLRQDQFNDQDLYYKPKSETHPSGAVNLRKDKETAQNWHDVYHQGDLNSCTANAAAAAFWYEEVVGRKEQSWGDKGPSRLFLYWLARGGYGRSHDADTNDGGSSMRDAMKGLRLVGVCSEQDYPYLIENVSKKPVQQFYDLAEPHKINKFFRLDLDRPDEQDKQLTSEMKDKIGDILLDRLKKCLSEGFPVAFGFWFFLNVDASFNTDQNPPVLIDPWNVGNANGLLYPRHTFPRELAPQFLANFEKNKDTDKEEPSYPGHSILAIGYDDQKGAVLIQNSWGKWPEKTNGDGTFWMPYTWITDFAATNDFWTIRLTEGTADTPDLKWEGMHKMFFE